MDSEVEAVRGEFWFVALDVDDQVGGRGGGGDFGDAVGAGGVVGASQECGPPEVVDGGGDAWVVSGDEEPGDEAGLGGGFENVLDEGFAGGAKEGFAGKAGRGESSGDDAEDFHRRAETDRRNWPIEGEPGPAPWASRVGSVVGRQGWSL